MADSLESIALHDHNGTPVVSVAGEIDISNAHVLRDALNQCGTNASTAIDLSGVTFIDSTGLNAIAQFGRALIDQGNELFLITSRPALQKIFEITNFDRHFTVLPALADLP